LTLHVQVTISAMVRIMLRSIRYETTGMHEVIRSRYNIHSEISLSAQKYIQRKDFWNLTVLVEL